MAAIPDTVSIFVDVNPGMHRTGVPLEDADTILAVARAAGARFRGVHYYDGGRSRSRFALMSSSESNFM